MGTEQADFDKTDRQEILREIQETEKRQQNLPQKEREEIKKEVKKTEEEDSRH